MKYVCSYNEDGVPVTIDVPIKGVLAAGTYRGTPGDAF